MSGFFVAGVPAARSVAGTGRFIFLNMPTATRLFGRLGAVLGLLLPAVVGLGKPTYLHGRVGCYDVVSAMPEKDTRNLVIELMEIRQNIKDLTGMPVVFEPNTQILVFATQKEMNEFFPEADIGYGYTAPIIWAYNTSKAGDVIALVGDRLNDKKYRQNGYAAFGRYLLARMVPECPPWIYQGLSEYLSTVRHRDGTMVWGEASYIQPGRIRADAERSFEVMMSSNSSDYDPNARGAWHCWLSGGDPLTRGRIRALFEAIRMGEGSGVSTVSKVFGISAAELEAVVRKHVRRANGRKIESPATAGDLALGMQLKPATMAQIEAARHIFAGTIKEAPGRFYVPLAKYAADNPDSPIPFEALARRATEERDEYKAAELWEKARERGTANPYAYLSLIRQRIGGRIGKLDLKPALPDGLTAEVRTAVDRCIALNPGELEAYTWMAWIEALATSPDEARLDAIVASKACFIYPAVYIPTAAAYLRLDRKAEARQVLEEYLRVFSERGNNRQAAEFLLGKTRSAD